jgi:hypothetical protein
MAASAPAPKEQELADQVKAQQIQSSTKRSAQRAGAHRSARRGLRRENRRNGDRESKTRVHNRGERTNKAGEGYAMSRGNLSHPWLARASNPGGASSPTASAEKGGAAHTHTNAARRHPGTVPMGVWTDEGTRLHGLPSGAIVPLAPRILAGTTQRPRPPTVQRVQQSAGPPLSSTGRCTAGVQAPPRPASPLASLPAAPRGRGQGRPLPSGSS